MSLEEYVKNAEKYSLSDDDVMHITENLYKIWTYDELKGITHIDQLLGDNLGCILLYQNENRNNGHWVSMWRDGNILYYFDPYGLPADKILDYYKYNKPHPYLSNLLRQMPYKLITNKYKYQKLIKDVNTCGRWCAYRLRRRDMTQKEFHKLFNNRYYDYDFWISILTSHCGSFNS